jgi:hypothetical protein
MLRSRQRREREGEKINEHEKKKSDQTPLPLLPPNERTRSRNEKGHPTHHLRVQKFMFVQRSRDACANCVCVSERFEKQEVIGSFTGFEPPTEEPLAPQIV